MEVPTRRERERQARQELILDAAFRLFVNEGFEKATVRRIAEETGYTPGAIYAYFADKDALLYELHNRAFGKLFEYMATSLDNPDPFARLMIIGRQYLQFAATYPQHYELMFMLRSTSKKLEQMHIELCETGALPTNKGHQTFELLKQTVQACMENGSMPTHDIDAAALCIWGMAHGMATLQLTGRLYMLPAEKQPNVLQEGLDYMIKMVQHTGSYNYAAAAAAAMSAENLNSTN